MSLRSRATAALLLATVAGSLVATPTAAAGTTRWVDDDGLRGATGCDGTSRLARTTIQEAVDASVPGDTVKVCPGVYKSEVSIETVDLEVVAVKRGTAVITHPTVTASAPAGDPTLVIISANDVTFSGFKLRMGVEPACVTWSGILVVAGTNTTVSKNILVGRGDDATKSCGMGRGITFIAGASGLIQGNSIKNWNLSGIFAQSAGTVRILGNQLTWTKTLPPPATSATRRARSTTAAAMPAGAPDGPAIQVGLSDARVVGNTIVRVKGAALPQSNGGIVFTNASGRIKNNTVTRFAYGITAGYDGSAGTIEGNTLSTGRYTGIYLYSLPMVIGGDAETNPTWTVSGNTVHGFAVSGIELSTAPLNHIDHNIVTKNGAVDCKDNGETFNAWHWNKGNDSDPTGLCTNPAKR